MSKRAVIYARVSTDMQRDNYSISSQVSEAVKYSKHRGYAIVGDLHVDAETGLDTISGNGSIPAYVDDYTSREISRPSLDAALSFLETTGSDILIVHSLDRLARDPYIRQTLEQEFIVRGASVEFVLGNYEETPEGEVRKDLDAVFAKWENTKRVERCNRGKRRKAESGYFVGGRAPYGYKLDKNAPGGLQINEHEAELVNRIFQLYVDKGFSIRQISQLLTDECVPPQLGGCKWGKSSVSKILQNTAYIGHCFYNKNKRDGIKLIKRDRSEWIRIDVTPIVEKWIFNEAQRRLAENRRVKRRQPKRFYLLTGMVFCSDCERPYFTQAKRAGVNRLAKDALSYRHRVKESHCINRMISARKLEPLVWEEITHILLDPERLRTGYEASIEQQEATLSRHRILLESLQCGTQKLEQQKKNLTELYIDPDINLTKTEYLEQKHRIEDEITSNILETERLQKELASVPTPTDLETIEKFASRVRVILEGNYNPTPEEMRKILELLHVKVWIGINGEVKVSGGFDDDSTCLSSTTSANCDHRRWRLRGRA